MPLRTPCSTSRAGPENRVSCVRSSTTTGPSRSSVYPACESCPRGTVAVPTSPSRQPTPARSSAVSLPGRTWSTLHSSTLRACATSSVALCNRVSRSSCNASCPKVASAACWRARMRAVCSASHRSVTSRKFTTTPPTSGSRMRFRATSSTHRQLPSRCRARTTAFSSAESSSKARVGPPRNQSRSARWMKAAAGLPTIFSGGWPSTAVTEGVTYRTWPFRSNTTTASPLRSTRARNHRSLRRSASCSRTSTRAWLRT
ncbi:hypothetical protein HRbin31_00923 [bacterium HR31]|nr:hypothetical protein HRbin31_00923 [bacterium HR31]